MGKRLAIYLAVTFGLSWGLWIPAGIALGTFEHGVGSSAIMFALVAIGMFFPLAGALAAQAACKNDDPFELRLRPCVGGIVPWYVAAWLAPAALALLGAAVYFVLMPQEFDPTMTSYLSLMAQQSGTDLSEMPLPPAALMALTALSALTYAPFLNMLFAFGEEAGWRGMLYPVLAQRMSQRAAALASGVIWGVWHAPIIAMGHNYGMGYAGFPLLGILTMTLACTAMGVCMAYLWQRTENVWPCALAHGSFNAVANLGVALAASGQTVLGPSPLALLAGIPLFALGIACLLRLK